MEWPVLLNSTLSCPSACGALLPYLFDQFSCIIEWVNKTKVAIPNVIHILDDFLFVTKPPRSDYLTALCNILCLFTELVIPISLGKTFVPTTSLDFISVLLDSYKNIL